MGDELVIRIGVNNDNNLKGEKTMTNISWMITHTDEHIDPKTGILNMTALAEDCADTLHRACAGGAEFEAAHQVGEKLGILG